jgi:arginine decarboxylase
MPRSIATFMRCRSPVANPSSSRTGFTTWASSTAESVLAESSRHHRHSTACQADRQHQVAQEKFARAVGADHVFFVTNGTSTSNKMVYQAVTAPGDIVIADRNCHKSHHYGMVLSGAQPLYVEAYPMTEYSMYGAVPLRTIKQALLNLKAEGRLDRLKMVTLTNCTFDGHVYNTFRVMQECLAIKPDLLFLWDEAWFGFARFSPFLRPRTGLGAAAALEEWRRPCRSGGLRRRPPRSADFDPKDARLLKRHLVPDPRKIRIRVYETDSVHKSMSALRQGSIVAVRDEDYNHHASASAKQCSSTPRPRRTSRSSPRWTLPGARWSWRAMNWSCARSRSR